jgi:hypothetical protein
MYMPPSEAGPLTVDLLGAVQDVKKPYLVIFTGEQLHLTYSTASPSLLRWLLL